MWHWEHKVDNHKLQSKVFLEVGIIITSFPSRSTPLAPSEEKKDNPIWLGNQQVWVNKNASFSKGCTCKDHRDLIVFDGDLCITKTYQYYNKLHLQIWVMERYGVKESWVMKLDTKNLGLNIVFPFKERADKIRVLGQLENRKILLNCTAEDPKIQAMLLFDLNRHEYEFIYWEEQWTGCILAPSLNWIPSWSLYCENYKSKQVSFWNWIE